MGAETDEARGEPGDAVPATACDSALSSANASGAVSSVAAGSACASATGATSSIAFEFSLMREDSQENWAASAVRITTTRSAAGMASWKSTEATGSNAFNTSVRWRLTRARSMPLT